MTWAFADHVWQSTLFAVAAGGLTLALRKNMARVRYWVWFTASVKFLVPLSLLMQLGSQLARVAAAPGTTTLPATAIAVRQVARPFSSVLLTGPAETGMDWLGPVLVMVWLSGIVVLALARLRTWRVTRAVVRQATTSRPSGVQPSMKRVSIRTAPGLREPAVVGVWRPILLLPAGVETRLTPAQLDAVLVHELCHVRRRDNLTAAVHMIVEAVFWFHPFAWWIGARLVQERERACDEDVLMVLKKPRAYADAILSVCRLYAAWPTACASGTAGSNLRQRLEDIMANRIGDRLNPAKRAGLALSAVFAVLGPILLGPMTMPAQAEPQGRSTIVSQQPAATREAALKTALLQLRQAIDRYQAEQHKYPGRLTVLVREGYLKAIPTDPVTGRRDSWRTIVAEPGSEKTRGTTGIFDVRSGSRGTASDGTRYADW